VFRLASRLVGNATDAEDLPQDAFLRAWRAFASYDRSRSFSAWMLQIVSNLAIDRWRRRPPVHMLSLDQTCGTDGVGTAYSAMIPDGAPGPEQQCVRSVLGQRLRNALVKLPEPYRTTVVLADLEELSYRDVATTMQCSLGTVRSRLHRGRVALRKELTSASVGLSDRCTRDSGRRSAQRSHLPRGTGRPWMRRSVRSRGGTDPCTSPSG